MEIATLAAVRATPEDIEEIRSALNKMVEEVNAGEVGDVADAEFHFAVVKAAHNPILVTLIHTISDLLANTLRFSRQKIFLTGNISNQLYDLHCSIFQAIVDKAPKRAGNLMYKHLTMVEKLMLELKQEGVTQLTKFKGTPSKNEIKIDCGFPS